MIVDAHLAELEAAQTLIELSKQPMPNSVSVKSITSIGLRRPVPAINFLKIAPSLIPVDKVLKEDSRNGQSTSKSKANACLDDKSRSSESDQLNVKDERIMIRRIENTMTNQGVTTTEAKKGSADPPRNKNLRGRRRSRFSDAV